MPQKTTVWEVSGEGSSSLNRYLPSACFVEIARPVPMLLFEGMPRKCDPQQVAYATSAENPAPRPGTVTVPRRFAAEYRRIGVEAVSEATRLGKQTGAVGIGSRRFVA